MPYRTVVLGLACAMLLAAALHTNADARGARQDTGTNATGKARAAEAKQAALRASLAVLAGGRINQCKAEAIPAETAYGWHERLAQCAWRGRLQMRRWESEAPGAANISGTSKSSSTSGSSVNAATAASCLSSQAGWWAAASKRIAPVTATPVWSSAWTAQSLSSPAAGQHRIGIIERKDDGTWRATEWSWSPPSGPRTRKREQNRWKLLEEAASALRRDDIGQVAFPQAASLRAAWQKNLQGRPAEITPQGWAWESEGLCLRMETAGLSDAQIHLPYARENGRAEQRAAMQLLLARTYPKARWLTEFKLMPQPDPSSRAGAQYEAIWIDADMVKGQLWLPRKSDGSVLRARIATAMADRKAAADTARTAEVAAVIHRELAQLASTWAADHGK